MGLMPLTCVIAAVLAPAAGPEPVLKRSIPLPGVSGRIDHLAYDPQTHRLFIAALENGSLEVVDLEKGERIAGIGKLDEPQGVVFVPTTSEIVVACGGDGTIHAFDAVTLEEHHHAAVGEDADNMRLDADGKNIVVGHSSGALALLDAATLQPTGDVQLSGHPESFQLESGTSRVFVNVPGGFIGGGGKVAVADRSTQKVTATWHLGDAGRNFPMALDSANKRLYVGCRRPARLLVLDTDSGNIVASPTCVGDADDVFVDSTSGRVLVIGGDGAVDVFETTDHRSYAKAASIKTVSGARTGLWVPELAALFLAVPKHSGQQAELREYTFAEEPPSDKAPHP